MKRVFSLLLAGVLSLNLMSPVFASSTEATKAADTLYSLGLFSGIGTDANGNPIYDLERSPTRQEAITILVGLLGKKEDALNGAWDIPFTDVADWAKPFVGYAYTNGLTSGTSATTFGGNDLVSASQYLTFVLKALGYETGKDFQWDKAWELSDKIGLTHGEYDATTPFTRGDVSVISLSALSAMLNHSDRSLIEGLVAENAVSVPAAVKAGMIAPKGDPDIWGVHMQCSEVEYDHQSGYWPVVSSEKDTLKLTITAFGEDQYQRPFDVDSKNGFFWGLTTGFDHVDGVNFKTTLNGVSIEPDEKDSSVAVVTIPPNTEAEVWVYAGVQRGVDFIRYPYLLKITSPDSTQTEEADTPRAWYETDENGDLYIRTNIDSGTWDHFCTLVRITFQDGSVGHDTQHSYGDHPNFNCTSFISSYPVGKVVKKTEFAIFDTKDIQKELISSLESSGNFEQAIKRCSDRFVTRFTLDNTIKITAQPDPITFTDFSITYDIEQEQETYSAYIDNIQSKGEYGLVFRNQYNNQRHRGSYMLPHGDKLSYTRELHNFGTSGETGFFHITHCINTIDADGTVTCQKAVSNELKYTIP